MAATQYDIVLNGTKARLIRGEGAYSKRYVRHEVEQQLLSQGATGQILTSQEDQPAMYQSTWADGAHWWKPLIGFGDAASYFQSNHMDTWSEPGKVVPANKVADAANTNIHDMCIMGVGAAGLVYAIGSTNTEDATNLDVYVWTPGSNAFVRDAGVMAGVDDAANPMAMAYDPSDGYFYVLVDNSSIGRFNPVTPADDVSWISSGYTGTVGQNIMLHNGALMVYSGDQVYTVTKGTPAVAQVYNDGLGTDILSDVTFGATDLYTEALPLAISTPEGLYYVKNTNQGGQVQAFVFRVDKDAAGNYIGNPIATLPLGTTALSIQYHLGSVVISTSPDAQAIRTNATVEAEVVLYHVTQGGMGALGSMLGGRDELDETPYALLGSDGPYLYIGGQKRLWVYDAIRGGLHTAFDWETALSDGPYRAMAWVNDSSGQSNLIFLGKDRIARQVTTKNDDPDTVAAFGDDEAHYILESNYFDGGLPMEIKELTKVAIQRDPGDGGEEWEVWISADDAAFASVLAVSASGVVHGEDITLSGTTGYRFRYKLVYQTKDTARKALRSLLVGFSTGIMKQEWELVLDGTEMLNIDNKMQDPAALVTALEAIAATETQITFSDNFRDIHQRVAVATTVNVKVRFVQIDKSSPEESNIRVVIREA